MKYLAILLASISSVFAQYNVQLTLDNNHHLCEAVIVSSHQIITANHCIDDETFNKVLLIREGVPYQLHAINYNDKKLDISLIEVKGNFTMSKNLVIKRPLEKNLVLRNTRIEEECVKQSKNIYSCKAKEGDSGSSLIYETKDELYLNGILTEGDSKKGEIKVSPIPSVLENYIYPL